jgi:hypothetical protein
MTKIAEEGKDPLDEFNKEKEEQGAEEEGGKLVVKKLQVKRLKKQALIHLAKA